MKKYPLEYKLYETTFKSIDNIKEFITDLSFAEDYQKPVMNTIVYNKYKIYVMKRPRAIPLTRRFPIIGLLKTKKGDVRYMNMSPEIADKYLRYTEKEVSLKNLFNGNFNVKHISTSMGYSHDISI